MKVSPQSSGQTDPLCPGEYTHKMYDAYLRRTCTCMVYNELMSTWFVGLPSPEENPSTSHHPQSWPKQRTGQQWVSW